MALTGIGYDVAAVRARFPALLEGAAHFDGPGGSQTPESVAEAVAATLRAAVANRGLTTVAERRAEEIVVGARQAMADLLGCSPDGVIFGRSMTALTYEMSRTLSRQWAAGDEIVVSRLDHDANVRPWVQAAQAAGVKVRWADFDTETGELPAQSVANQLGPRTRLVAVTAASNLIGTRPDIPRIAEAVHSAGALLYVDGVHLTAHCFVDTAELGADFYACSPYKFLGPHLGVLAARPELLEGLHPDKLLPATDQVPERFELGTLPYELLAGTTAAVDFLAGLAAPDTGERRRRLESSLGALQAHESRLRERLEAGLAEIPGTRLIGRAVRRTPTTLFTVSGREPAAVAAELARHGVNAPAGSFYAFEPARALGLGEAGGVRAGIAPYTDDGDVDRLLDAVKGVAAG